MKYAKLGRTGLDVSRLALGCMTFGAPDRGRHVWTQSAESGRELFRHAVEAGINFFDTANTYSGGTSEEVLGQFVREFTHREEVVVATKVYNAVDVAGPNRRGLSRKAIFTEIDASLRRLDMDYVDLYQVHRWDEETPIEETMEALHDVVKSGRARYLGASNMRAWQFAKAQEVARSRGWTPFISMQCYANLLYREEERDLLPMCADQGVGVIPWSPLARGRLARPRSVQTLRSRNDSFGASLAAEHAAGDASVIDALEAVANARGEAMARVALSWLLARPEVTSPIIGASSPAQIDDAVAALEIDLDQDELTRLDDAYIARPLLAARAPRGKDGGAVHEAGGTR